MPLFLKSELQSKIRRQAINRGSEAGSAGSSSMSQVDKIIELNAQKIISRLSPDEISTMSQESLNSRIEENVLEELRSQVSDGSLDSRLAEGFIHQFRNRLADGLEFGADLIGAGVAGVGPALDGIARGAGNLALTGADRGMQLAFHPGQKKPSKLGVVQAALSSAVAGGALGIRSFYEEPSFKKLGFVGAGIGGVSGLVYGIYDYYRQGGKIEDLTLDNEELNSLLKTLLSKEAIINNKNTIDKQVKIYFDDFKTFLSNKNGVFAPSFVQEAHSQALSLQQGIGSMASSLGQGDPFNQPVQTKPQSSFNRQLSRLSGRGGGLIRLPQNTQITGNKNVRSTNNIIDKIN